MTNLLNIVIAGATGTIGKEVLGIFAERNFPSSQIIALASSNSIGQEISYGEEKILKIQGLENFDFQKAALVIFCTPAAISQKYMGKALAANCRVIALANASFLPANSSYVIPEVNGSLLANHQTPVFLTPNPGAIMLALVLQPFIKNGGITQAVVTLLQAVSGGGREAMDELFTQTRAIYMNAIMQKRHFTKQIAFNLIPHIGEFTKEGGSAPAGFQDIPAIIGHLCSGANLYWLCGNYSFDLATTFFVSGSQKIVGTIAGCFRG